MNRKKAFTLAEVLITLGIIGIVAALTLPSVINNYKEKETVAKLKKLNSTFQNAFNLMKQDEFGGNDVNEWEITDSGEFVNSFTKYLQVSKVCGYGHADECFYKTKYSNLGGVADQFSFSGLSGFILNDGSSVAVNWLGATHYSLTGDWCQLFVDINGKKPPNVLGRDMFSFFVRNDKLIARGSLSDPKIDYKTYDTNGYCNKENHGIGHNGLGCTAWVIYMENLDYLK